MVADVARSRHVARKFAWLGACGVLASSACGRNPFGADNHVPAPAAQLSVRLQGANLDVTGREVSVVAGDSLSVLATVENRPEAYDPAEVTASDPTQLQKLADGLYSIRRAGVLKLSATARAKSSREPVQQLITTSTIDIACTADMRPGIRLTVRDSLTGLPISFATAQRLRATTATRVDSAVVTLAGLVVTNGNISPGNAGSWALAFEATGVWSLELTAAGYRPWRQDAIAVPKGLCHVMPVNVTANLQPQ